LYVGTLSIKILDWTPTYVQVVIVRHTSLDIHTGRASADGGKIEGSRSVVMSYLPSYT